jgi:ABC-2 type transport system ATP-binding protein
MDALIEVSGLKKIYKGNHALVLKGVDVSIRAGEFFGLLGPNAAGKTTLISIMCGLLKITEGHVRIKGMDISHQNYHIRHLIGLIPQEIALYPTLTIRENFRFFGQMYGLKKKVLNLRIEECLELLKLHAHADKRVPIAAGGLGAGPISCAG